MTTDNVTYLVILTFMSSERNQFYPAPLFLIPNNMCSNSLSSNEFYKDILNTLIIS